MLLSVLDAKGSVVQRWEGFVAAQDRALEIERQLRVRPSFRP
jgi:hypothetical protein